MLDTLKRTPLDEEPDNRMTSKDYSVFFRSLYNATYLSAEYSQLFLHILNDVPAEYLGQDIPADVVFAHKTGIRVDKNVWADSGIVYVSHRPYLLTVMIQQKDNLVAGREDVHKIFQAVSGEIYNYVTGIK
jgi:hypothetical protein